MDTFSPFHWGVKLFDPTIEFLKQSPELQKAPRLILASGTYKVNSSELKEQATSILYSLFGGFNTHINADNLYLVGGELSGCLRRTTRDAIEQTLQNSTRQEVSIHYAKDLVYSWAPKKSPDNATMLSLSDLIKKGYFKTDGPEVETFFLDTLSRSDDHPYRYEANLSNPKTLHYVFRRIQDNKLVHFYLD